MLKFGNVLPIKAIVMLMFSNLWQLRKRLPQIIETIVFVCVQSWKNVRFESHIWASHTVWWRLLVDDSGGIEEKVKNEAYSRPTTNLWTLNEPTQCRVYLMHNAQSASWGHNRCQPQNNSICMFNHFSNTYRMSRIHYTPSSSSSSLQV